MPANDDTRYEITVTPKAHFLPEHSDAGKNQFVFGYTIEIRNTGTIAAQLLSRHWVITDADGDVHEVKGDGVVGEQPILKPGEAFEYQSGSQLSTEVGTMQGTYTMLAEDGTRFDAPIPRFTLSTPRVLH
jgi:ApaG protein